MLQSGGRVGLRRVGGSLRTSLALRSTAVAASEEVRPFEEIPRVPGGRVPMLGNMLQMALKAVKMGETTGVDWKVMEEFRRENCDPAGINMLRIKLPMFNPENNGNVLAIFEPEDVQSLYKAEGKYPYRGPVFQFFRLMKQRIPMFANGPTGLITEEGEDWKNLRSMVQQDLMRPKSAVFYADSIEAVADDFTKLIRRQRDNETNIVPGDFLKPLHQYTLESIGTVAVDARFGCIDENPNQESVDFVTNMEATLKHMWTIMSLPAFWRMLPNPRWDPNFRKTEDLLQELLKPTMKRIDNAKAKILAASKEDKNTEGKEISILEKLIIKHGPNSTVPTIMAIDLIFGGIDSTGNLIGFILYQLAKNPEAQEKLRKEIAEHVGMEGKVTASALDKMHYLKACVQESLRMNPIVSGSGRIMPEDTVIGNHSVPKGTYVLSTAAVLSNNPKIFKDPQVFRPERWERGGERDSIHPFASLQFGHGPRMCIGKRFADMEVHMLTIKILQNFKVEWAHPDVKELGSKLQFVYYPDAELKFKFTDL